MECFIGRFTARSASNVPANSSTATTHHHASSTVIGNNDTTTTTTIGHNTDNNGICFDRPIGAEPDVKEIEYVSFLHQTGNEIRTDGTIRDEDIRNLLLSRYGVCVSIERVRDTILQGLGSGNGENDVIDLMELTAILIIPVLVKANTVMELEHVANTNRSKNQQHQVQRKQQIQSNLLDVDRGDSTKEIVKLPPAATACNDTNDETTIGTTTTTKTKNNKSKILSSLPEGMILPPSDLIEYVSKILLHDVTGNSQPKPLTKQLVKRMLTLYGEYELATDDELIHEMVQCCYTSNASSSTTTTTTTTATASNSTTVSSTAFLFNNDNNNSNLSNSVRTTSTTNPTATVDVDCEDGVSASQQQQQVEDLLFNKQSFGRALTYDVQLYDIHNEVTMTVGNEDLLPPKAPRVLPLRKCRSKTTNHQNNHKNTHHHQPTTTPEGESTVATTTTNENHYHSLLQVSNQSSSLTNDNNSINTSTHNITNTNTNHNNNIHDNDHKDDDDDNNETFLWGRIYTAPAIDISADTFRSKLLMVLIWTAATMTFFLWTYNRFVESQQHNNDTCTFQSQSYWHNTSTIQAMTCQITNSIVTWLFIFTIVGIFGLFYTSIGSVGNTDRITNWYIPLIGCIPFGFLLYRVQVTSILTIRIFQTIVGSICILLHVSHAIALLIPKHYWNTIIQSTKTTYAYMKYWFQPGSFKAEQLRKQSTAYKVNAFINNAFNLVKTVDRNDGTIQDTYFSHAITEYTKYSTIRYESIGGTIWTWYNIYNEQLLRTEGISFSVRVISSNIGQFIITITVVLLCLYIHNVIVHAFQQETYQDVVANFAQQFVNKHVHQTNIVSNGTIVFFTNHAANMLQSWYDDEYGPIRLNCTNLDIDTNNNNNNNVSTVTTTTIMNNSTIDQLYNQCERINNHTITSIESLRSINITNDTITTSIIEFALNSVTQGTQFMIESIMPTNMYMIKIPLIVFMITSVLSALMLSVTYIPNVTTTILQLRCGIIPTLHETKHKREMYRIAPDTLTLLTGSLFWGCFVSSILTGTVYGLLVFLFLWQVTAVIAQRFVAVAIGIVLIYIMKFILMQCFRTRFCVGFYRKRPLTVNICILALEWANFTLTSGIIFVRMIVLTLIALFSIGRIYKPFLANGIGTIGPLEADGYPTIHTREVLAHEAHRHPYIELLGTMYLMKLKHSTEFGKRAGSCWRLLFLYALMPWLQKYRCCVQQLLLLNHHDPDRSSSSRTNKNEHPYTNSSNATNHNSSRSNIVATTIKLASSGGGGNSNNHTHSIRLILGALLRNNDNIKLLNEEQQHHQQQEHQDSLVVASPNESSLSMIRGSYQNDYSSAIHNHNDNHVNECNRIIAANKIIHEEEEDDDELAEAEEALSRFVDNNNKNNCMDNKNHNASNDDTNVNRHFTIAATTTTTASNNDSNKEWDTRLLLYQQQMLEMIHQQQTTTLKTKKTNPSQNDDDDDNDDDLRTLTSMEQTLRQLQKILVAKKNKVLMQRKNKNDNNNDNHNAINTEKTTTTTTTTTSLHSGVGVVHQQKVNDDANDDHSNNYHDSMDYSRIEI